jgi:hypothetical protein
MPTASDKVRCRGKTGSAQRTAKTTLMTQNGHSILMPILHSQGQESA